MSDDLISRKALIEEIQSFRCSITGLRAGKGVLAHAADEYMKSVSRIIDEQPAAFDKRKVVEKLENLKNNEKKYWEEMDDEDAFGAMCAYAKAIIVVNKGGLNECKNIFKRQRSELIDHKGIS